MTVSERPLNTTSNSSGKAALVAADLGLGFGSHTVLKGVSFHVRSGEFICLVGPSGVGKTTLLRCLAGLQTPSNGSVTLWDNPIKEGSRGVAVVFQDYSRSLLPWTSVTENVALPLRAAGMKKAAAHAEARKNLDIVGLPETAHTKYPWQLSGGMQQRVAIARALASAPTVILMDEPFASVDAQTRADLEDLMIRLQRELHLTVVLVTHDIDEAVYLSDRVVVLRGSPAAVAEIITVDLSRERDQITSKSSPVFTEARTRVINLIKRPPPNTTTPPEHS